jgi:hypothetical protein
MNFKTKNKMAFFSIRDLKRYIIAPYGRLFTIRPYTGYAITSEILQGQLLKIIYA